MQLRTILVLDSEFDFHKISNHETLLCIEKLMRKFSNSPVKNSFPQLNQKSEKVPETFIASLRSWIWHVM